MNELSKALFHVFHGRANHRALESYRRVIRESMKSGWVAPPWVYKRQRSNPELWNF